MRETGTQISHNPSSNAKLGNGIARVPEMLAAGHQRGARPRRGRVQQQPDMFEVMKFASLMHRASRVDPSLQQAPDVVRMATRNGSAALQPRDRRAHGREEGRRDHASTCRTRCSRRCIPENKAHLYSHLVFAANGSAVNTTIVDGKIVYRDHEFTTIDEQEVLHQANVAFRAVLDRMVVPDLSRRGSRDGMPVARWSSGTRSSRSATRTLIPDGALDRRGPRRSPPPVRAPSSRRRDRSTACSAPPRTSCCRGSSTAHYHSELAIGPGLYQFIFERANVFIQGGDRRRRGGGPVRRRAVGAASTRSRAGRPRRSTCTTGARACPTSDARPALRAYEDSRDAHGVRAGQPRREHLRPRAERAVPVSGCPPTWPRRSAAPPWATRGRSTT